MAKTIFDIVNEKQSQIEKKTEFSKENIARELDSLIEKYEEVKSDYDVLIDKCNKFLEEGKTFKDFKKEYQTDILKVLRYPRAEKEELVVVYYTDPFLTEEQKPFDDLDFVNSYKKLQEETNCCKNAKKAFLNNDFEAVINNLKNIVWASFQSQSSFTKIDNFLSDQKNNMPVISSQRDLGIPSINAFKENLVKHFGDKKEINTPEPKSKSLKSFFTKTKENTGGMSMS